MEKLIWILVFVLLATASRASFVDSLIPYGRHAFSAEFAGSAGKYGAYYDFTFLKTKDARFLSSVGIGFGQPYYNNSRSIKAYTRVAPHRLLLTWRYKQVYFDGGYVGMYTKQYGSNLREKVQKDYAKSPYVGVRWQSHTRRGIIVRAYWMRLVTEDAPFVYDIGLGNSSTWVGHDPYATGPPVYNWWGLGLGYHF
jgi:hypothetical protein